MNVTLAQLKQSARAKMDNSYPGGINTVLKGALLYLLLTNWIQYILSLVKKSPLDTFFGQIMDAIYSGSNSAVTNVFHSAPTLFQGTTARVTLFLAVLVFLYTLVMDYGYSGYVLALYRGERPSYRTLFSRFDQGGKIILLSLVIFVCTYLWSSLFLIPGVIAWYRYRMSRYLLLDHPEAGVFTVWNQSKRIMRGHKMALFLLDLSFLLWILAAYMATNLAYYLLDNVGMAHAPAYLISEVVFTAFYVYLTPYMELSVVGFYHKICPSELLPPTRKNTL